MFFVRHGMYGHGAGLVAWLFPLVLIAVVVGVVVLLVVSFSSHDLRHVAGAAPGSPNVRWAARSPMAGWTPGPAVFDPAVEQARLRYARGDMTRDEYLRMVEDLRLGCSEPAESPGPPNPDATAGSGEDPALGPDGTSPPSSG